MPPRRPPPPPSGLVVKIDRESFAVADSLRRFLNEPAISERGAKAPERTEDFALVIRYCYRHTVEGILAMGYWLRRAKMQLDHGDFGRLFPDHPEVVAQPVPFSQRTADRLMAIATHPCFAMTAKGSVPGANSTTLSNLPSSMVVLYELSRLSPPALRKALESGQVSSEMTVTAARALVSGKPKGRRAPAPLWHRRFRRAILRATQSGASALDLRRALQRVLNEEKEAPQ